MSENLDADVKKTIAAGAKLLTGGHPLDRKGNFYAPTVLTDVPKNSPAYGEELFGPVASIFREGTLMKRSESPTMSALGWARALGPMIQARRSVLSMNSKQEWLFSIRW